MMWEAWEIKSVLVAVHVRWDDVGEGAWLGHLCSEVWSLKMWPRGDVKRNSK